MSFITQLNSTNSTHVTHSQLNSTASLVFRDAQTTSDVFRDSQMTSYVFSGRSNEIFSEHRFVAIGRAPALEGRGATSKSRVDRAHGRPPPATKGPTPHTSRRERPRDSRPPVFRDAMLRETSVFRDAMLREASVVRDAMPREPIVLGY